MAPPQTKAVRNVVHAQGGGSATARGFCGRARLPPSRPRDCPVARQEARPPGIPAASSRLPKRHQGAALRIHPSLPTRKPAISTSRTKLVMAR